jgi:hypothetical protein
MAALENRECISGTLERLPAVKSIQDFQQKITVQAKQLRWQRKTSQANDSAAAEMHGKYVKRTLT